MLEYTVYAREILKWILLHDKRGDQGMVNSGNLTTVYFYI